MPERDQPQTGGEKISVNKSGKLETPKRPIIPFIEGDGIGADIWQATRLVLDTAVDTAFAGEHEIAWLPILAGEAAQKEVGEWLPEKTIDAIRKYKVAIKGPLTTPVGGGFRSLNVTLRQILDLYACVRPVRYFRGVPAPVKEPEKVDFVIFRENTEDVYAGIEWAEGTEDAKKLIRLLEEQFATQVRADSGIGIKPISVTGTKRLVAKAIQYAIDHQRESVTLVHKGNIMKFTEGAFKQWGYEVAKEQFGDATISEAEVYENHDGKTPKGKILIKDRIADAMFQQILIRPDEYDVIATSNLNGDYLSDAGAAQVGGLGMAPGANMGESVALFEATHGTAPKYAGQDKVNPSSLILSGVLMLEHLGWQQAADLVTRGLEKTLVEGRVTYDLARQMQGATELKCSEFAKEIVQHIRQG